MILRLVTAAAALLLGSAAAQAQSVSAEIATDESRRGLSWTGGRATASADLALRAGPVDASLRVTALRNAGLHGGADAVIDLGVGASRFIGPVQLSVRGAAHLFTGAAGHQDYAEAGASASYTLGPVRVNAGADYAPHQNAIGGSNLYLFAGGDVGVPATPLTLYGQFGRSSGDADGDPRANRLRPAGSYNDWRLGADHVTGPLVLSLEYVGTALPDRVRHHGDRLVARARLTF